jgi:aspartokinase
VETIAVYWENKVKTYGFQIERELSLFQLSLSPHEMASLGMEMCNDSSGIRFSWVLCQPSSNQRLDVYVLLNRKWAPCMQNLVERSRENRMDLDLEVTSPVEMVSFHGPHFGDRYGIADTALGTLEKKGLPILAAGCSGASVYIIVPEQRSAETKHILSDVFDTPHE